MKYFVEFFGSKGWEILTETDSLTGALMVFARELHAGECDVRMSTHTPPTIDAGHSRRV